MSLFGKLLAALNLLGALGLIYLASVDYGARQQWAYVVFRHDLAINGLPVDPTEPDKQALAIVDQISDETAKELFSGVGNDPVKTQVAEVERVQAKVNAQVQAHEANKRQQAFTLATILLPLSDSLLERDEYLATQAHLSSDAARKALEARYAAALLDAKKAGASGPDRPFAQAFRLGVRSQGGAPSEAVTTLIVAKLPADPKADVNVQKLLADAREAQREGMLKRLEGHFAEAPTTAEQSLSAAPGRPQNSRDSQRAAIARVLFGLTPALATAAIQADGHAEKAKVGNLAPGTAAWVRVLAGTDELKRLQRRVFVVSGVKTALDATSARSSTLRLLASQVDAASSDERILFLSDLAALLDEAREQAERVRVTGEQIRENQKKLGDQQVSVKQRQKDVEEAEAALKDSIAETEKAAAKLRAETERGRAARVKARDLIGTLAERERQIRELERQVREAEAKKSR
ncbi:MAG: hypothetical protein ACRC33_08770 [Gemmataceae bacterium]